MLERSIAEIWKISILTGMATSLKKLINWYYFSLRRQFVVQTARTKILIVCNINNWYDMKLPLGAKIC